MAHSTLHRDVGKEPDAVCRVRVSAPRPALAVRRRKSARAHFDLPKKRAACLLGRPQRTCEDLAEPCGETLSSQVAGAAERVFCSSRARPGQSPRCLEQSRHFGYSHRARTRLGALPGPLTLPGKRPGLSPVRCSGQGMRGSRHPAATSEVGEPAVGFPASSRPCKPAGPIQRCFLAYSAIPTG